VRVGFVAVVAQVQKHMADLNEQQIAEGGAARAVVLLSGGLDSATVLAIAQSQGYEVFAISFRYGQRHEVELARAAELAERAGVARHAVISIDLRQFGGSALTADIPVPKGASVEAIGTGVPVTYVPARNTVFLSLALAFAESVGASDIFVGVNALDYSGYPDCRPEYVEAFEAMANLATKAAIGGQQVKIHAPLIQLTKAQIIAWGSELGVDYSRTSSCYDPGPDGAACGYCDACLLRLRGFAQNQMSDPAVYAPAYPSRQGHHE
jgi:7-cyano-7-deazaguanine synthase